MCLTFLLCFCLVHVDYIEGQMTIPISGPFEETARPLAKPYQRARHVSSDKSRATVRLDQALF